MIYLRLHLQTDNGNAIYKVLYSMFSKKNNTYTWSCMEISRSTNVIPKNADPKKRGTGAYTQRAMGGMAEPWIEHHIDIWSNFIAIQNTTRFHPKKWRWFLRGKWDPGYFREIYGLV